MKKNILRFLIFLIGVFIPLTLWARDYAPEDVENPNIADRRVYVADPGNLMDPAVKARVNNRLASLREQTTAEVAVAIVPSIGDIPIEEFGERLFTRWGLGKKDKDNGVLILIAPEQRRARIQTGYGAEGALPDISAKKIIERSIVPNMREGDLDAAVDAASADVAAVLFDPAVAEELRSSRGEPWEGGGEDLSEVFAYFVRGVALLGFLIAAALFVIDLIEVRGKDRYRRSLVWHRHRVWYWVLAVCSLGSALIFLLLEEWLRWRARNKPVTCEVCGHKMKKLGEAEDNELLSPAQDLEEKLKTVDYDVWVCPECGSVERYPFPQRQSTFTECPQCHTIAMCEVRDHTLVPATTRREGTGEKEYECMYCHHVRRKRYRIPRKEAPPVVVLPGIGGGRGGGGGFGGGFGGGATGGGGASGGW